MDVRAEQNQSWDQTNSGGLQLNNPILRPASDGAGNRNGGLSRTISGPVADRRDFKGTPEGVPNTGTDGLGPSETIEMKIRGSAS